MSNESEWGMMSLLAWVPGCLLMSLKLKLNLKRGWAD